MNIEVKFRDPIIFLFTGKARHGKDTAASFLKDCFEKDNKKVIFSQYAKYIKFYCKEMYGWDGSEETKPRELLQKLGTEVIRNKLNKAEMFIERQVDDIEIYSYFYDAIMVSDMGGLAFLSFSGLLNSSKIQHHIVTYFPSPPHICSVRAIFL